jgi:hypothetical protein
VKAAQETELLVEFGLHPDEWLSEEVYVRKDELDAVPGLRTIWANDWALTQPLSADGHWTRFYGPEHQNLANARPDRRGTLAERRRAVLNDEMRASKRVISVHGTEIEESYAFYGVNAPIAIKKLVAYLGLKRAVLYANKEHFSYGPSNFFGIEISRKGPLTIDDLFRRLPSLVDLNLDDLPEPETPVEEYLAIGSVSVEEADEYGLPAELPPFSWIATHYAQRLGFTVNSLYAPMWSRKAYGDRTGHIAELAYKLDSKRRAETTLAKLASEYESKVL